MNLRIAEGRVWIDGEERRDIVRLEVFFDPRERTRFVLEAYADEIDILEAGDPRPPAFDMSKLMGGGGAIKVTSPTIVGTGTGFAPGTGTYTVSTSSSPSSPKPPEFI